METALRSEGACTGRASALATVHTLPGHAEGRRPSPATVTRLRIARKNHHNGEDKEERPQAGLWMLPRVLTRKS